MKKPLPGSEAFCQILLEAVNVVPFLIFYLRICLFWIALDNSIKNFFNTVLMV